MLAAARIAASDHATSGRPPSSTSDFGPPAPSLSPEPAAAITAAACADAGVSGGCGRAEALLQQPVDVLLGPFLVLVEGVHELRRQDLLGAGVHLLLACREALLVLADREVADDL